MKINQDYNFNLNHNLNFNQNFNQNHNHNHNHTNTNWGTEEKYGKRGITANSMSGKSGLGVPES